MWRKVRVETLAGSERYMWRKFYDGRETLQERLESYRDMLYDQKGRQWWMSGEVRGRKR